ncbi:MAG: M28 family peptidase, partial [Tepidisphaeraceae bacterium]
MKLRRVFAIELVACALLVGCSSATHIAPTTGPTVLTVAGPTTSPSEPQSFDPARVVPYLASDQLEGRGIGLPGLDLAADFLAGRFKAAGLKTLPGMTDYFQAFDYTAASAPGPDCALALDGRALKLDEDFRPLIYTGEGNFDGLVVFAGYGITSAAHNYDDYAGLDVRGKIVLAMRFEPMTAGGKSLWAAAGTDWSADASLENKAKTAAAHGAAALLLFTPDGLESEDVLAPFSPGYHPVANAIPAFHVKRNVAASILGAGTTIKYSKQGKPSAEATQVAEVSGAVHIARTVLHVKNIVGCVPGAGPHADEYVVVGAHYDHLGRGKYGGIFGRPGAIYHGADDNASGASAVVELAQHAAAGPPRQRTMVFCLFTAEEEGLIGSEYFTSHPPIDLGKVVAMFNMDMVGRVQSDTVYVGGEGTAVDLENIVKTAERGQPLTAKSLPASVGGRGGLGP